MKLNARRGTAMAKAYDQIEKAALSIEIEQVMSPDGGRTTDGPVTVTLMGKSWSEQITLSSRLTPTDD